jgi:hypothetical protein
MSNNTPLRILGAGFNPLSLGRGIRGGSKYAEKSMLRIV